MLQPGVSATEEETAMTPGLNTMREERVKNGDLILFVSRCSLAWCKTSHKM
jgi:hypothetical protein